MRGQIQSHADTSPNTLIVHSCMTYDTEVNISGWGDVVETKTVDADGEVVKSRADGAGRTLETEDQDGNLSTMRYDANGNLKESRDANSVGVDIVYDDLNRPTSRADTWGDETTTAYYLSGMVKTETDAKSKSKTFAYDERGRRDKVTDRLGNDTTYTYDKTNNLLSISDAESRVTSYTYNSRNLKDKETYPDHTGGVSGAATYGIVEFSFDDAGRVEMKTDQNGDTVTFNYDLAGRMTKRDYRLKVNSPSGTIADSDTFTFDKAGRQLTAVSGRYSNTVTMTYDMAGRLDDESLTISGKIYTVSNEYNDLGQLHKQTYPDSTVVERAYTDRGQLYTVKYGSNIEDTRTYDVGGRLSTSTYRNGFVTTYNYRNSSGDKDNLISSIVTTNSGTQKIGTYTYTYDANKNKTKETITLSAINNKSSDTTAGTDPDGYDDDDRLTYWKRSDNNLTHEWTLTDVGDWSALKTNGTSVSRTHSNTHEVTAIGATSLTHDVKGNLTANPLRNHNYTWDFDNRMSGADTDGDTTTDVSFEYDALGRRVKKGSTVYAYSGQQVIAEYSSGANPSSPTEQYVYASYIDEPIIKDGTLSSGTGIVYYSRNQQYSITGLTDTSGNVVERYSYSAYGDLTIYDSTGTSIASSAYANPYTYTGRRFDTETELYHFRARVYDSSLGRFIVRDPHGFVDGMSLYGGYFAIQDKDPSGTSKHIQIRKNSASLSYQCGIKSSVSWDLALPRTAPCNGYIVQKVIWHCGASNCPCKSPLDLSVYDDPKSVNARGDTGNGRGQPSPWLGQPKFEYFEAWYVSKGSYTSFNRESSASLSWDTGTSQALVGRCGYQITETEVKFYCQDKNDKAAKEVGTGDLGGMLHIPKVKGWSNATVWPAIPGCGIIPSANNLPATTKTPEFWDKTPVFETSKSQHSGRFFATTFSCCKGCPKVIDHHYWPSFKPPSRRGRGLMGRPKKWDFVD